MLPIHFTTSPGMPVMRLTLALLCSFAVCCRSSSELHQQELQKNAEFSLHSHIFKESMPLLSTRTDLIKRTSVQPDYIHELIFVVQQQNMEELTRILHDVSNPSSPNYGQHMSVEQVSAMTMNVAGRNAIVDYLHTNGAAVTREILSGDLITAIAPVSVWEKVLDTKFYTFHQLQLEGHVQEVVGAETYSIPRVLESHLQSVLNVIEMPAHTALGSLTRIEQRSKKGFRTQVTDPPGYLRPQEIREFYNMTSAFGSALSTQSAVGFSDNYFSPLSLAYFQEFISFQKLQPALTIGGFVSDSPLDDSGEGNLDIQYLIGISPGSPTTFWHNDGGFNTWLNEVLNTPNPPLVLSMSYGMQESMVSAGTHEAVTTAAKKLGIIGVTLVVASGDDGASGTDSRSVPPVCAYQPYFPAGNPYFTAIGGTVGAETGIQGSEVVCQFDTGNRITSGGGFSKYYSRPAWQDAAVAAYIIARDASGQIPVAGYDTTYRGIPDLAFPGDKLFVRSPSDNGGATFAAAGTSASCPIAAGIFSNINAARLAVGKGSIGWANPFIYEKGNSFFNDVTIGNNKFPCPQGYYATPGWDPTTGFGSVNYGRMKAAFLAAGATNGFAPTGTPISAPSASTILPTGAPAAVPVASPTGTPSAAPIAVVTPAPSAVTTDLPTGAPAAVPVASPTGTPSAAPIAVVTPAPSAVTTDLPTGAPAAVPAAAPIAVVTPAPSAVPLPTDAPAAAPAVAPASVPAAAPPASVPAAAPASVPAAAPPASVPAAAPASVITKDPTMAPVMTPPTDKSPRPTKMKPTQDPARKPSCPTREVMKTKRPTCAPK